MVCPCVLAVRAHRPQALLEVVDDAIADEHQLNGKGEAQLQAVMPWQQAKLNHRVQVRGVGVRPLAIDARLRRMPRLWHMRRAAERRRG